MSGPLSVPKKILVADDEESVRNFSRRLLEREGFSIFLASTGRQAVELAKAEQPDLILLDVQMPEMDGYSACKNLRADLKTRFIPIIILSSKSSVSDKVEGLTTGADDYVTKPCDPEELKARVQSVLLRSSRNLSSNPLTKLPGNPLIEEEVNERIRRKSLFGFAYLDIDYFKAYNDLYGFKKGDEVIQFTASLLIRRFQDDEESRSFVGHIGGDDFVFITDPSAIGPSANKIAESFDRAVPDYYSEEDRKRGFVVTKNRQDQVSQIPLMSISIAIVTNEKRVLSHYGKVVELASEMKRYAKSQPGRKGSLVVRDNRQD